MTYPEPIILPRENAINEKIPASFLKFGLSLIFMPTLSAIEEE